MHTTPRRTSTASASSGGDADIEEFDRAISEQSAAVASQSTLAPPRRHWWERSPRWVRDWRTWATVLVCSLVLGLGTWRFLESERGRREQLRLQVEGVAQFYAHRVHGQVLSSLSSINALSALLKVDDKEMTMSNFPAIAQMLIDNLEGITNLQLAPAGTLQFIHPLVSETVDNRGAIGHALLIDPARKAGALGAINSRSIVLVGPLQLLQGGVAIIARFAVFTPFAPEFLADESWTKNGVTYTRNCSEPETRVRECHFPGPTENGTATHFWGFATMLTSIPDLLRTLQFEDLADGKVLGMAFHYQFRDLAPHPSMKAAGGIFAHSLWAGPDRALVDPVRLAVSIPELNVDWCLDLAPQKGWPAVSSDFWIQLALLIAVTSLMAVAAGYMIIGNVREMHQRLERLEAYRRLRKTCVVEESVSDLNRVRFPMCVMAVSHFRRLGKLISHEEARRLGMLVFLDSVEALANLGQHVVFFSHQWTSFTQPDPSQVQFISMVRACAQLQEVKGLDIRYIWVDFLSIPQVNTDQQQAAIDSLAVYAAHSRVFVAVAPPCPHADLDSTVDFVSYSGRGWCRLEQVAYLSAHSHQCHAVPAFRFDEEALLPFFDNIHGDSGDDDMEAGGVQPGDAWQSALEVVRGQFSCCARCHPDGSACDKERIVSVMLGMIWRIMAACKNEDGKKCWHLHQLMELLEINSKRYFPPEYRYVAKDGKGNVLVDEQRELFGDLVGVLSEMFERGAFKDIIEV